ncbi:ATP-binding protein [Dyadobacter psychrophilus]|uniref:Histidine kinase-, DNA gyrase B-, and HSP90-like ATPase n=1 Tax=Dyadobacter psychrophilus TaxID=651661 RepID=A0A1T5B9R6_9BACT|nr:ATP-binding protein [Dyadobacter psychrophilus]SKB43623.1 hypothetical protein SAMN05660293_00135 [Dyadobacter psychrophilus]
MVESTYIQGYGIHYVGALSKIPKSNEKLQPLYEALTNSLEAIRLLSTKSEQGVIKIKLHYTKGLFDTYEFYSISIEDSGIGFNNDEYERLINLNDTRKGFNNKGSGRVQFLHFFDKTEYTSIFEDKSSSTGFRQRKFTLSKSPAFLRYNAIIRHDSLIETNAKSPTTTIVLSSILNDKDRKFYNELSISELKDNIINRYLPFFCENRDALPRIIIEKLSQLETLESREILPSDIPTIDKQDDIIVHYCKSSNDGKSIERIQKSEKLNIKGFKIDKSRLQKNSLKLTSKGEIAKEIKLDSMLVDDEIDGNRYLFLISGSYIDERDSDNRGALKIPTIEEFRSKSSEVSWLFGEEEIVLDDIREKANEKVLAMYEEIAKRSTQKLEEVEKLQKMFLLDPNSIKEVKIKLTDTDEDILEKVYRADAKLIARRDAEIKKRVDLLDNLDPNSPNFRDRFLEEVNELTRAIPQQNRTQLTHYVARRKLVLDLFGKILDRKLLIQNSDGRNLDEALIHNVLFQKGSDKPESSDLWIINEDFIYFSGSSERQLSKLKVNGKPVFKSEFTIEEDKYLLSLGENRKIKRPDVLLFPEEGKCIILEFKSPEVNVSDHLTQIDLYANLIRNYTQEYFQIMTFYGYLIGESIEPRDVLGRVSSYEHSYHFDYLFRPAEKVNGFDGRPNGSIYTEVIKYSTLLKRAKRRNSIFIDKL